MNKKIIALAVASAMAAPLAAQAEATVYGKAHLSIDKYSSDYTTNAGDDFEVASRASRVGVKASEDLGGGLKAIAQMEFQIDMADDNNGDDFIKGRNAVVGLAGDFGTFVVGRHDTPYKMSTGKLEYFGDTVADSNTTAPGNQPFLHDVRADNAIAYISPNLNGLTIAAAVIPGEDTTNSVDDNGAADDNKANGLTDSTSIALMYSAGPIYVSVANEVLNKEIFADDEQYSKTRLGVGYSGVANLDLSFVYEAKDTGPDDADADPTTMVLAAKYAMGANSLRAAYHTITEEAEDTEDSATMLSLGVYHSFSKSTSSYVVYRNLDGEADNVDVSALSLGMEMSF